MINREYSNTALLTMRGILAVAFTVGVEGCIQANVDPYGVIEGSHVKTNELLRFICTENRRNENDGRSTGDLYLAVVAPGPWPSYIRGELPTNGEYTSGSYCIVCSAITIEEADHAVVVRIQMIGNSSPRLEIYDMAWFPGAASWHLRQKASDPKRVIQNSSAPDDAAATAIERAEEVHSPPHTSSRWIWREGKWKVEEDPAK